MTRYGPEEKRKGCHTGGDKNGDPYCAAEEKFLHIWLANSERAEWRRFGLAEENEEGVQLVLVRYEEEDGDGERNKKLRVQSQSRD